MYICSDIIHIIQIYHHIIHIMHIYKRRIERRHFITKGCNAFVDEYSRHAQIKFDLWKGIHSGLPGNRQSWKYDVYESMLLSRAGYENYLKGNHKKYKQANYTNLPSRPAKNSCFFCNNVYRSSSGLRRHVVVRRNVYLEGASTNWLKKTIPWWIA